MAASLPVVAIVDDDEAIRRSLSRLLKSFSYDPRAFASGGDFIANLGSANPQCVLLDQHMPGMTGLAVLRRLKEGGSKVPVVVITGHDELGLAQKCLDAGASDYLVKPVEALTLIAAIRQATIK